MIGDFYKKYMWLASYPKSGNTWLRFLFQAYLHDRPHNINGMLPCFTGDNRTDMMSAVNKRKLPSTAEEYVTVRMDALLLNALMYEGNYMLAKTHNAFDYALFPEEITTGAIYILRNPFDVAISYAEHLGRDIDHTIVHMATPEAIAGGNAAKGKWELTGSWGEHVDTWTKRPNTLILRYEDMVDDTEGCFRKCIDYLGIDYNEKQMEKALRETKPTHLRALESTFGFREKPAHTDSFFKRCSYGHFKDTLTVEQMVAIYRCFPDQIKKWYPEYALYDEWKERLQEGVREVPLEAGAEAASVEESTSSS